MLCINYKNIKMDFESISMGLVIMALCALPFVFMGRANRKKRKQLLQSLNDFAHTLGTKPSCYEFERDYVIALSEENKHLLFFHQYENYATEVAVDLSKIRKCEGLIIRNNQSDNLAPIEHLELMLVGKKAEDNVKIELYNLEEHYQLGTELELMRKWEALINSKLV